MPLFNGDIIFLDSSGQIIARSGDLTLRADDTGSRAIIVGSGATLRPERDIYTKLGTPDLRWLDVRTSGANIQELKAYGGAFGVITSFDSIPIFFPNGLTLMSGAIAVENGTLNLGLGTSFTSSVESLFAGITSFFGVPTFWAAPTFAVGVSGNLFPENHLLYSLGTTSNRWSAVRGGSGVFNVLGAPSSGTYIGVENADFLPTVDASRALGALANRWGRVHAASGIFNVIGAPTSGTHIASAASIVPNRNDIYALGNPTAKWANIFASSGNFSSSLTGGTLNFTSITGSSITGTTINADTGTIKDLSVTSSLVFTGDGMTVTQLGQINWMLNGSTLDFFDGAVNFNGGIGVTTADFSSNVTITGSLSSRNIIPQSDRLYAIGTSALRYSRIHAASGVFNQLAPSTSGTFIQVNGSLVPERTALYSLGTSSLRWGNIFATSGNITTIDSSTVNAASLIASSVNSAAVNADSITANVELFAGDLTVHRNLFLDDDGDGGNIVQGGPIAWDIGGSTLDFSNGTPSFNDITVLGGINGNSATFSSSVSITGNLNSRNIIPQSDRLYAIGTAAARYSRAHVASGIFNQLAAPTSGTFIQSNASIVPEIDAFCALGTSSKRWAQIFAASGTVNTLAAADLTTTTSFTSLGTAGFGGITALNGGTFFGNSAAPSTDAGYSMGLQGFRWANVYVVSGFMESILPLPSGGSLMIHGHALPGRDMTFDLGNSASRWGDVRAGSGTFTTRATVKGYPLLTNKDARTTLHAVITANSGAIISNTNEVDIYNFTVPANILSASGKLMLELVGSVTNMSAANVNFTPRVYVGGTNIWGDVFAVTQGPRPADFAFYLDICSLGSLTGQRVRGAIELGTRTAGSVTGNGDFGTANVGGTWSSTATSGTTSFSSPVNIRVSMQLGTSSPLASYSGFHGILTHQPYPTCLFG